jgi:hypothetical protein
MNSASTRTMADTFKREQPDLMLSGAPSIIDKKTGQIWIMKR